LKPAAAQGDRFELGKVALTVKHTPGHTPEHIALLVAKAGQEASPFAVLSGGSLLVDAAGRTDLLGPERTDAMTRAQFKTLRGFFLALDDGVAVYPTHVHGSPCGAAIGDKTSTTVGYERQHNPLLQPENEDAFRKAALADLPPKPRYYPRLKERNRTSQPASGPTSWVPALPPDEFKQALSRKKAALLDTRHLLAFGGGHIPGALNIGMTGHLGIWAGWMLEADEPLLVVLDGDDRLEKVVGELARTGFERFDGYLVGGMSAWENRGFPLQSMRQIHVNQLAKDQTAFAVLDVRSPQEWQKGRVPGARHIFLPDLPGQLKSLHRERPLAVYCDSGYRASIGASLLQREGFDASVVPGSWRAWTACDLPVEKRPAE
jgi:hydroxyacylglutathione hydrolase